MNGKNKSKNLSTTKKYGEIREKLPGTTQMTNHPTFVKEHSI